MHPYKKILIGRVTLVFSVILFVAGGWLMAKFNKLALLCIIIGGVTTFIAGVVLPEGGMELNKLTSRRKDKSVSN